jgi:hypothetical protein
MTKFLVRALGVTLTVLTLCLLIGSPSFSQDSGPADQPAALIHDEMRTVYLGNQARRDNGLPPLH